MKCIVQRVSGAEIVINGSFSGKIDKGLVVLCGFTDGDDLNTVTYCVDKIVSLRIFEDENGKMNKNLGDTEGNIMVVSNFTLYGDTSHGRRPSFDRAAKPAISKPLYDETVNAFRKYFPELVTGEFGADMRISCTLDGPVTLTVEKENE